MKAFSSNSLLIKAVTLSFQLASPQGFTIDREGAAVERLRGALFDYGLQFSCKEFRNERSFVERAEFYIAGQISVSAAATTAIVARILSGASLQPIAQTACATTGTATNFKPCTQPSPAEPIVCIQ